MIIFDSHTHTSYSHDAKQGGGVEDMCRSAISKGIRFLAITDHYDVNEMVEGINPVPDLDRRKEEILAAKEKFSDKLFLSHGIELGSAIQYPEHSRALLDKYRFDTVIASVHYMRGHDDFYHWDMTKLCQEELANMWLLYLADMEETVDFGRAHILAHFNYPLRYAMIAGKHLDVSFSAGIIERIVKKAIAKDMLFEVNSSGFRQGIGAPLPGEDILSIYRDCGGRMISAGSDAHYPKDVGADYDLLENYIKKCGFRRVYFRSGERTEEQKI